MVVRVPALVHLLACSITDSHEHLESTSYVVATSEQGTAIRELLGPRCREGLEVSASSRRVSLCASSCQNRPTARRLRVGSAIGVPDAVVGVIDASVGLLKAERMSNLRKLKVDGVE